MKLHLTEKFLWDIYKIIVAKDKVLNMIMSKRKRYPGIKDPLEIIFPEIHGLRDMYLEAQQKQRSAKIKKENFSKMVSYLKKRGYLNIKDLKNREAILITPKGMEKILNTKIKIGEKNKRKDGKWQMVLFDIPENNRNNRDHFRKYLKYLGYQKLQQSIWACPYDVLKETEQLIKRYKLERFVRLLLVEEVKI